jgi:hypothetical protein
MMPLKGFHTGESHAYIRAVLDQDTTVSEVRLKGHYAFVRYTEGREQGLTNRFRIAKTGITKQPPSDIADLFSRTDVYNLVWDFDMNFPERITTFVAFWQERSE